MRNPRRCTCSRRPNAIKKYDIRQLVELGIEWIWLGLEFGSASYAKLKGTPFRRDFEVNGPSLYRLMRNMLGGWRRYRADPDPRVRARVGAEGQELRSGQGAVLWAMEKYLRDSNPAISHRIRELRQEIERELGGFSRAIHHLAGPLLLWKARGEARFGPMGRRLEPRTFVERRNWA